MERKATEKDRAGHPAAAGQEAGGGGYGFVALANRHRKARKYREALQVCRSGLERYPDSLSARAALALILYESGDLAGARKELETVLDASPTNLLALRTLARLCRESGDAEKARRAYEELVWLAPGDSAALQALASLEEEAAKAGPSGRVPGALAFAVSEGEEPSTAGTGKSSGSAPALLEVEEEAEEEIAPEEVPDAGTAEDLEGPEDEARAEKPAGRMSGPHSLQEGPFPDLAEMDISDPMYTRTLARLYEEQGHSQEALTTYRMVLKENPRDEDIRRKVEELERAQRSQRQPSGSGPGFEPSPPEKERPPAPPEAALSREEEAGSDRDLLDVSEDLDVEIEAPPEPPASPGPSDFESELARAQAKTEFGVEEVSPSDEEAALPSPEAEEKTPAGLEDLLGPEEEFLPEERPDEKRAASGEPVPGGVDWLADLDEVASDLEVEPAGPERGRGPSAPPPPRAPAATSPRESDPSKENAIRGLEGLLERVRTKSKKDKEP